jgi:hypothetical protein
MAALTRIALCGGDKVRGVCLSALKTLHDYGFNDAVVTALAPAADDSALLPLGPGAEDPFLPPAVSLEHLGRHGEPRLYADAEALLADAQAPVDVIVGLPWPLTCAAADAGWCVLAPLTVDTPWALLRRACEADGPGLITPLWFGGHRAVVNMSRWAVSRGMLGAVRTVGVGAGEEPLARLAALLTVEAAVEDVVGVSAAGARTAHGAEVRFTEPGAPLVLSGEAGVLRGAWLGVGGAERSLAGVFRATASAAEQEALFPRTLPETAALGLRWGLAAVRNGAATAWRRRVAALMRAVDSRR